MLTRVSSKRSEELLPSVGARDGLEEERDARVEGLVELDAVFVKKGGACGWAWALVLIEAEQFVGVEGRRLETRARASVGGAEEFVSEKAREALIEERVVHLVARDDPLEILMSELMCRGRGVPEEAKAPRREVAGVRQEEPWVLHAGSAARSWDWDDDGEIFIWIGKEVFAEVAKPEAG